MLSCTCGAAGTEFGHVDLVDTVEAGGCVDCQHVSETRGEAGAHDHASVGAKSLLVKPEQTINVYGSITD